MNGKSPQVARCLAGALAFLLMGIATLSAGTFESFNGKFHITYPDTWDRIDYRSVDFYLTRSNPNPELLDYEAVFAPISDQKFFDGPYLLLTIDTIGELIGPTKDSALVSIARGFGNKIDSTFSGDLFANLQADAPRYDPTTRLLVAQTDIHEGRILTKRNLLVVRLYEHGLANFYFYAPDSLWNSSLPTFAQIARSFTPGSPQAGPTRESVKIADIESGEKSSSRPKAVWLIPPGFVVILIAIIVALRKRKERARQSGQDS
ncbi:MAG: hypothetical protein HY851_03355 [candidate division Zixibacteria bacterium]|nr:hypothetical protein [candidate division Zixibacteria bacterium]